jgi:hypothetical protein
VRDNSQSVVVWILDLDQLLHVGAYSHGVATTGVSDLRTLVFEFSEAKFLADCEVRSPMEVDAVFVC